MSELSEEEIRAELDLILERRNADTRLTTMGAGSDDLDEGRRYLANTVAGGWHVPTWPVEHGGQDASASHNARIGRVLREFIVPDLYPFAIGLGMVGPALLTHGSSTQQTEWLKPIASGESIWCQMFSEPEAGSDLANVALSAQQDGEEWIVGGQKTWTSRAMWADWAICLARTDPAQPKHKGLTMFALPMSLDGVEIRPLTQMNRDAHFSEVFVDDARVLDRWRIGDVGEGWRVAMTVLAHERAGGGSRGGGDGNARGLKLPSWIADLQGLPNEQSGAWRNQVANLYAHDATSRWTSQRAADEARSSGSPGPAGSGAKLRNVKSYKGRSYLTNMTSGAHGMLEDGPGYIETMTAPSMSIRGGTDEIQRNILGERVLGLPGEPRLDRDVPWSESRRGLI
ncbi:MAG: acyl-CoA dehydrogenase family protein [Acidimicrobiales bacterium]|nr:acyl-CoA dehydrogenase family protein [Acidimicrobiales bacterium]